MFGGGIANGDTSGRGPFRRAISAWGKYGTGDSGSTCRTKVFGRSSSCVGVSDRGFYRGDVCGWIPFNEGICV